MIKKILLLCLAILLLVQLFATAAFLGSVDKNVNHISLLAVTEKDGILEGYVADLSLELSKGGNGRVFMDTIPLTKLDTQISTRFAKEIACDLLDIDCSNYDFIYTIHAESNIIGGPSAGAAITVLTLSSLKGMTLK